MRASAKPGHRSSLLGWEEAPFEPQEGRQLMFQSLAGEEWAEPVGDIGPGGLDTGPPSQTDTIGEAAQRPDQRAHGAHVM